MVTIGRETGDEVNTVIRRLATIPTNVLLCPDLPELTVPPSGAGIWLGTPALTVQRRPIHGWNGIVKRAEDIVLTSVLLLLALPIMGLVAAAVKLDSRGPVFFRQKRLGFNNNVFSVWKFRSMTHTGQAEAEIKQARRDDPRVTRIGRFLRRTSLDELPQLFNILRGEMSLVGPRPHALSHNEFYAAQIDDYLGRHRVLPGLTGLAQVKGLRGETDSLDKMRRRIEQDLRYIEEWSLLLDLKIIVKTVLLVLSQKNAY
jgi:putative colanic acid biosynthesis UDP-glucose lipid carrier transferase